MSDRVRLLMGPWYHVTNFDGLHINALQLRWFDQWLQDDASAAISDPPFTFQAIGCRQWFHAREFPLAEASPARFYLCESGRLSRDCTPDQTLATLDYAARGPVAGRSLEQWTLGMNSFFTAQRGRRIRYDADNRRLQRRALTYTTEPFTSPTLVAGPITLTLHATADTTETLWVAHLDDVAPDGTSRPLTQGALLGSHRALDPTAPGTCPTATCCGRITSAPARRPSPSFPASSPLRPRDLPDRRIYRTPASAAAHPHHLRLPAPGARQAGAAGPGRRTLPSPPGRTHPVIRARPAG
ncbi:hydrolase CocE/NonD family protein [Mycobacterium xenopi 3993]|nr:hydrolase CocE/NonD family protein [Mycobacterium xenopi 3993]